MLTPNAVVLGDCLEVLKKIPDNSIDMILTDPPYNTTRCRWDLPFSLEVMWQEINRVMKENRAIVMTASPPFTFQLYNSNIEQWRYNWVWDKKFGGNFVQAKRMPIRERET